VISARPSRRANISLPLVRPSATGSRGSAGPHPRNANRSPSAPFRPSDAVAATKTDSRRNGCYCASPVKTTSAVISRRPDDDDNCRGALTIHSFPLYRAPSRYGDSATRDRCGPTVPAVGGGTSQSMLPSTRRRQKGTRARHGSRQVRSRKIRQVVRVRPLRVKFNNLSAFDRQAAQSSERTVGIWGGKDCGVAATATVKS
jgi:hypothetical protein